MEKHIVLDAQVQNKLVDTMQHYQDKAALEMYAELFKCGIIDRNEFIKRASNFIMFTPNFTES